MRRPPLLSALALVATAACTDATSLLFPPPSEVRVSVGAGARGRAGEILDQPVHITVVDRHGNAIAGVPVTFRVLEGGGAVERPPRETNEQGVIELFRWRMGTAPGPNRLSVNVEGLEGGVATIQAGPGPPSQLRSLGSPPPRATVGSTVGPLPAILVADRFDNPVPGVRVVYRAALDGRVADSVLTSDEQGLTRQSSWQLGTSAGPQSLRVVVEGAPEVVLVVVGDPGPPARAEWAVPLDQAVEVGLFLVHAPVIRVSDAFGNPTAGVPVSFRVLLGGGRIEGAQATTDAVGRAPLQRWFLGDVPGPNSLAASVLGFADVVLTAQALSPDAPLQGRYFSVRAIHVNQGSQTLANDISLVAGRAGLVRVFVESSEAGAPAPEVDLRILRNGELLKVERISAPALEVPTGVLADLTTPSWNAPIPASWVGAGLTFEAIVDPTGQVGVTTRKVARYPLAGPPPALSVVTPPPFRVRFIPLRDATSGQQGNIHSLNMDAFFDATRRVLPIGAAEVTLAPAFTTDLITSTGQIRVVLDEMLAAWAASSFRDHYFHGIFPASAAGSLPFAGVAYVPNSPMNPRPVAQSWDRLPQASFVVAHEFGHNLGLPHAPCGNPAGVDPGFPYGGARLGVAGWDMGPGTLRSPSQHVDLMSYCSPEWISDYNYKRVLDWRLQSPMGSPGASTQAGGDGIVLWGRVDAAGVHLEPAFPVSAPALLPTGEGSHQLLGLSPSGERLFELRFDPTPLSEGRPGEGHFAFVVPIAPSTLQRLARIDLVGPEGRSTQTGTLFDAPLRVDAGVLPATVSGAPGAEVAVWDRQVFPLAVLRDQATNEIVGFSRSGRLDQSTLPVRVDVILSDGIRGWRLTAAGLLVP